MYQIIQSPNIFYINQNQKTSLPNKETLIQWKSLVKLVEQYIHTSNTNLRKRIQAIPIYVRKSYFTLKLLSSRGAHLPRSK